MFASEWVDKRWYIQSLEYCNEKNNFWHILLIMDEFQKHDIQWKEPEIETTYHMITLIRNVQERQIYRDGK